MVLWDRTVIGSDHITLFSMPARNCFFFFVRAKYKVWLSHWKWPNKLNRLRQESAVLVSCNIINNNWSLNPPKRTLVEWAALSWIERSFRPVSCGTALFQAPFYPPLYQYHLPSTVWVHFTQSMKTCRIRKKATHL